ncbi:MAG TPA: hypothetical protein VMU75_07100 [Acidimicrobiales bacterium]|nr:hypothetical protein [Acidimicrobiales bacterium]
MPRREHWKTEPDAHDYPAARDYLTLLACEEDAERTVAALRASAIVHYKAKDLLRASRLEALPVDNVHVALDLKRVRKGAKLSPVLLVRGRAAGGAPLTIADGYHRICASYLLNEDADIPCRLADLDGPR